MYKNPWKRFGIYERTITYFSAANLVFIIINKEILKSEFPQSVQGYIFFLSLGLYMGFIICKKEYRKALEKIREKEMKN